MFDKEKLKITKQELIDGIWKMEVDTTIKFKQDFGISKIVETWNNIVINLDDPQDLYHDLVKWITFSFILGHSLIDGNKRMSLFFYNKISQTFTYGDIQ